MLVINWSSASCGPSRLGEVLAGKYQRSGDTQIRVSAECALNDGLEFPGLRVLLHQAGADVEEAGDRG